MIDWDYVTESISFGVDIGRNVTLFESGLAARLQRLQAWLAEGNLIRFRAEAHKLDGDLVTLGISGAAHKLEVLRIDSLQGDSLQAQILDLEKWISDHIAELRTKAASGSSQPT